MLAKRILQERRDKLTLEAKLNKIMHLKELDQNFAAISSGDFFRADNQSASAMSSNLLDSVKD